MGNERIVMFQKRNLGFYIVVQKDIIDQYYPFRDISGVFYLETVKESDIMPRLVRTANLEFGLGGPLKSSRNLVTQKRQLGKTRKRCSLSFTSNIGLYIYKV